jgi:hypothetical protein
MRLEEVAFRLQDPEISELVHRLLNHADSLLDNDDIRILRHEIETSREWKDLAQFANRHGVASAMKAFGDFVNSQSKA